MSAWLSKWGALTGPLCGVVFAVALATGSSTPDNNATGQQVIQWYTAHRGHQMAGSLLVGLAMFFFVMFAAVLAGRAREDGRWLAGGALAGAVTAAIGLAALMCFGFVLAQDVSYLTPDAAQTLNVLQNDFFFPLVIGTALFGVLGGLAVAAGRVLPAWAGWVLAAVGVAALVPPLSWFALLGTMLWVLIAGIWLTLRKPPAGARHETAAEDRVPSLT